VRDPQLLEGVLVGLLWRIWVMGFGVWFGVAW
jgi:hypothetical protein